MTTYEENHVTSYDAAGSKPFKHDDSRGKWSSPHMFLLACFGHAFGLSSFSVVPVYVMAHAGVAFILPYFCSLFLFAIPVFFIQSFMGQFSSTAFISAFRIAPLFKGLGYIMLFLNITAACFYAVATAYPLVYFFISFNPNLPWMNCNNTWNTENCTEKFVNTTDDFGWYHLSWSTAEYYELAILNYSENEGTKISWPIFGGTILVWIIAGFVLYNGIAFLEKVIKYALVIIISILLILFGRVVFLPGAFENIQSYFIPHSILSPDLWFGSPYLCVMLMGSGWGTVMTFASYNNFKTDLTKYSLTIMFAITFCTLISGSFIALVSLYIIEEEDAHIYHSEDNYIYGYLFTGLPYFFGKISASNLWALMFYLMLFLCEFLSLILQMFAIFTALFDEFEILRNYKEKIKMGLIVLLGLISFSFTTNVGNGTYTILTYFSGLSKMLICFLELMIVVWIYGRERFQRDVFFMLNKTFSTWKFCIIRFISPIYVLILLLLFTFVSIMTFYHSSWTNTLVLVLVKFLPWLIIPGYIGYKLYITTGTFCQRLRKCVRPNDWYPADPADRQKYEEYLGSPEISHQLVSLTANEDENENENGVY